MYVLLYSVANIKNNKTQANHFPLDLKESLKQSFLLLCYTWVATCVARV